MTRLPVQGRAKLRLTINQGDYQVSNLNPHPAVAFAAWRLTKPDGTSYEVAVTGYGPTCSCPDYVWCREHKDPKGCKHVAALRALGLIREDE